MRVRLAPPAGTKTQHRGTKQTDSRTKDTSNGTKEMAREQKQWRGRNTSSAEDKGWSVKLCFVTQSDGKVTSSIRHADLQ